MNIALLYFSILLMSASSTIYQKAEMQAQLAISLHHEYRDSFVYCDDKIKSIVLKDSILNKPGHIGTEYNYPIYKFETEIFFYKDMKIAAIEKQQIQLKRYEAGGVTTGIQINAALDSLHTFYFDELQNPITRTEFLAVQAKICKEKE